MTYRINPHMDGKELVEKRYALLRYECARCTAEVANGLSSHFNKPIILKPDFETRLKLMVWRAISLRHQLSIQEAVSTLCDYLAVAQPKAIGKEVVAANSPVSYEYLTGKRAWNAMEKAVPWRYPDNEHIEARKHQQRQSLVQIRPTITYNELDEYIAGYKQQTKDLRAANPYVSKKPFRFSPWK